MTPTNHHGCQGERSAAVTMRGYVAGATHTLRRAPMLHPIERLRGAAVPQRAAARHTPTQCVVAPD
jgi:hypothetical protein